KSEFPEVNFVPPAAAPLAVGRGLRRPRLSSARLAIAAGILIALGLGGFTALSWRARQHAVAEAPTELTGANESLLQSRAATKTTMARLDEELRGIQKRLEHLKSDWATQAQALQQTIQNKKVEVVINGPRNFQAGARNTYQISMKPRSQPDGV